MRKTLREVKFSKNYLVKFIWLQRVVVLTLQEILLYVWLWIKHVQLTCLRLTLNVLLKRLKVIQMNIMMKLPTKVMHQVVLQF